MGRKLEARSVLCSMTVGYSEACRHEVFAEFCIYNACSLCYVPVVCFGSPTGREVSLLQPVSALGQAEYVGGCRVCMYGYADRFAVMI